MIPLLFDAVAVPRVFRVALVLSFFPRLEEFLMGIALLCPGASALRLCQPLGGNP